MGLRRRAGDAAAAFGQSGGGRVGGGGGDGAGRTVRRSAAWWSNFRVRLRGVAASYEWSATTDANGQARIEVSSSGYYQARVVQDGNEVGYRSSIPLNVGAEVPLDFAIAALEPADDPRVLTRGVCGSGGCAV